MIKTYWGYIAELEYICEFFQKSDTPPSSQDFGIIDQISLETYTKILAYAASKDTPVTSHDRMIDSGCTNHMFFDRDDFTEYQPHRAGISIANGSTFNQYRVSYSVLGCLMADGEVPSI